MEDVNLPPVFRIKRKLNEDPLKTLQLSTKRRKLETDNFCEKDEISDDILYFCGSSAAAGEEETDKMLREMIFENIKEKNSNFSSTRTVKKFKIKVAELQHGAEKVAVQNSPEFDGCHKDAQVSSGEFHDFGELFDAVCTGESSPMTSSGRKDIPTSSSSITCNGAPMKRFSVDDENVLKKRKSIFQEMKNVLVSPILNGSGENVSDGFVYDFYLSKKKTFYPFGQYLFDKQTEWKTLDANQYIDGLIHVRPYDVELFGESIEGEIFDNFRDRAEEAMSDSDDSNDENNWRNEYPDEDDEDPEKNRYTFYCQDQDDVDQDISNGMNSTSQRFAQFGTSDNDDDDDVTNEEDTAYYQDVYND